jgi:hypothetical protein
MASNESCFLVTLDYFQKPTLGGRPTTKPKEHGTLNDHNHWFILFYSLWGPTCIEIHWINIWLRAQSHMTSHYTWGFVITLHDFGGALGRPLDTFFWALTTSWSRTQGSWLVCEVALRATSHTRPKALDLGNVRALIGRKDGDCPSSLHTRRWRPKGPKKNLWMKSLHGVLHGGLWIRVHGLLKFASGPPPRGGSYENSGKPWIF